ncbi:S-methyl-5-thioribose kinase [Paenibacillus guangzhouensis]|uniref:S-methyl-5-thioribose kinase n=1 Tax=Paenibacillus guangzhouensis TaxID=1473112 RepID=UPI0012672E5D|nr:S-methyl-5-thioribose kinase [Paenibacillus guangzhouensis]
MSAYHPLTLEEAIQIAREIPDLFHEKADLSAREIGDGNLNLVFHISDEASDKSIILKQALPYAKVVGESWPLTLDRARIESEALILEHKLCPNLVPTVYRYDAELAMTIMEDLSDHTIMRKGLIEGNRYPLFAGHIAEFLARTLFFTSDLGMNQQAKKEAVKQFINPELCKITEDLIFADPYVDSETNNFNPAIRDAVEALWADQALKLEVAQLREKFLTSAQALLHGDLHTGSIFITEQSTKVIDPEFAYYGPMGFDIAAVLSNLAMNYIGQEFWSKSSEARASYRNYLVETLRDIWDTFDTNFRALWNEHAVDPLAHTPGYQDLYMQRLLQDAIGFAGCKMIRRTIGLAHVADIDTISDAAVKERTERLALAIGRTLIMEHRQVKSFDLLIDTLEQTIEGVHAS